MRKYFEIGEENQMTETLEIITTKKLKINCSSRMESNLIQDLHKMETQLLIMETIQDHEYLHPSPKSNI